MTWRHILVATGLALASSCAAANAAGLDDFFGDWRGAELQAGGEAAALAPTPADLNVRLSPEGAGFHISWTGFERQDDGQLKPQPVEASFAPTDRPGVFAFEPGKSSLLSRLFADTASNNPLEGAPLIWARLDGATLTVYRLTINADGGFDLDRYARTVTDQGMSARYSRRIENDLLLTIEGRLERAGG